jgi:acetamidase/formamidase
VQQVPAGLADLPGPVALLVRQPQTEEPAVLAGLDQADARPDRDGLAVEGRVEVGAVAPDGDEAWSGMWPGNFGGNLDASDVREGTTVYLPVWVDGALLSVGDAHAAQGDGEVCISAVEMSAHVTLRIGLRQGRPLREPQFRTSGTQPSRGAEYATTAHGPDLFVSSQQAIRYLIEHMVMERGLTREEAYVVASVAADLRISEIVDAPNWIVSAFLPDAIFG